MLGPLKSVNDFIKAALIVHIVLFIAIAFDIVILRQIVGFIYVTFIPGFAILRILRLQKLVLIEKIVLSVGLSIALLMFLGLLINQFYYIGLLRPLSAFPVIATVTATTLALCVVSSYANKGLSASVKLSKKLVPYILFAIFLPILSVLGVFLVNTSGNNVLLMVMILIISASFSLSVFLKGVASSELSPFVLFGISLALLLHVSLLTPYIYGYDIHQEYYVYGLTAGASHWNPAMIADWRIGLYNSMLSVTVLPTIYGIFLNIENTWILKVVYPLVYSLVPLGLYQLYKRQVGNKTASFSVLFFMSFFGFFAVLAAVAKQMVGELYFVLLLLLTTSSDSEITSGKKSVLILIFSGALVVSHYSMSYFYFFYIFLALLCSIIMKTKLRNITAARVALFFAIAFSWYIYTANSAPFTAVERVVNNISSSFLVEFFSSAGREQLVLAGLGGGIVDSVGHQIGRLIQYLAELFIVIGVIALLYDRVKHKDRTIGIEYFVMSIISMLILVMSIVLPRFSSALRIERIFNITLIILAPFCFLGVDAIFNFTLRLKTTYSARPKRMIVSLHSLVMLALILSYFLYNVGFVYEVTKDIPSSVALSGYRMDNATLYNYIILTDEVSAAKWLSNNTNVPLSIFSDHYGKFHVLNSYGMFSVDFLYDISMTKPSEIPYNRSYIFLRKLNVIDKQFIGEYRVVNNTEMSLYLDQWNKIYSNGYSEIYNDLNEEKP